MPGDRLMQAWVEVGFKEKFDNSRLEKAATDALRPIERRLKIAPEFDLKGIQNFRAEIAKLHDAILKSREVGGLAGLIGMAGNQYTLAQARVSPEAAASKALAVHDLERHKLVAAATFAAEQEAAIKQKTLDLEMQRASALAKIRALEAGESAHRVAQEASATRLLAVLMEEVPLEEKLIQLTARRNQLMQGGVTAMRARAGAQAAAVTGGGIMGAGGGMAGMIGMQASFAIQDFSAVMSATGNLNAAIIASVNNLQMIAMLLGGPLTGAIAGVAIGMLPLLADAFKSVDTEAEKNKKMIEALEEAYKKFAASIRHAFHDDQAVRGLRKLDERDKIKEKTQDTEGERDDLIKQKQRLENEEMGQANKITDLQKQQRDEEERLKDVLMADRSKIEALKKEIEFRNDASKKIKEEREETNRLIAVKERELKVLQEQMRAPETRLKQSRKDRKEAFEQEQKFDRRFREQEEGKERTRREIAGLISHTEINDFERKRQDAQEKAERRAKEIADMEDAGLINKRDALGLIQRNVDRFQKDRADIDRDERRAKRNLVGGLMGNTEAGQKADILGRLQDRIDQINETFSGKGEDDKRRKAIQLARAGAMNELSNLGPKTSFAGIADLSKMIQQGMNTGDSIQLQRQATEALKDMLDDIGGAPGNMKDNIQKIADDGIVARAG